jgi:hypothetical protein
MGGDEERARGVLEHNPQAVLYTALSKRKFGELVEICGSDEGARALVLKVERRLSERKLRGLGGDLGRQGSGFGFSKACTAQPKKKSDELVLLKAGSWEVAARPQ